jgi:hypothetical protein
VPKQEVPVLEQGPAGQQQRAQPSGVREQVLELVQP